MAAKKVVMKSCKSIVLNVRVIFCNILGLFCTLHSIKCHLRGAAKLHSFLKFDIETKSIDYNYELNARDFNIRKACEDKHYSIFIIKCSESQY